MKDIFKKVHLSEKKRIFRRLIENQIILLVKGETADVEQVIPRKIIDEKVIECEFVKEKEFNVKSSELAIVSVNLEEDKFFFCGLRTIAGKSIYIDIQGDMFYLQRRQSARLDLPEDYVRVCRILDYNGKVLPFDCDVVDISSGGCRLALTSMEPVIKVDSVVKLKITLGYRSPFEVKGEVRHVKKIKNYSDLPQVLGIRFIDYDPSFEAKILNMYMDIQREVFLKHLNKKNKKK